MRGRPPHTHLSHRRQPSKTYQRLKSIQKDTTVAQYAAQKHQGIGRVVAYYSPIQPTIKNSQGKNSRWFDIRLKCYDCPQGLGEDEVGRRQGLWNRSPRVE